MGCACNGSRSADLAVFVVTRPNGSQVEVKGERAARIEITRSGGGSYKKKG